MKLGLQLFSLIDTMNKPDGLRTVLRYAAECGYDGVEFAGFYGLSPDEIVEELKKNRLETAGIHLGWDVMSWENLDKKPEEVLAVVQALGAPSVTVASYGGKDAADWAQFARKMNEHGKMFREHGVKLGYHNHSHEFEKFDGKYAIDIIMENVEPENVFWELDPRHIRLIGIDPVVFAEKYTGRSPFMHVRDLESITEDGKGIDTAVGKGMVDIPAVVKASGHHDWLIVEEGPGPNVTEHVKESARYVRQNLM